MLEDGTPIRVDVPIDYHPDALLGIADAMSSPGSLGVPALAAARETLRLCYEGIGRLNDAERDLNAVMDQPVRSSGRLGSAGSNVRMIRGVQTQVQDATEFIDAAERAHARLAPAIDRRMSELRSYRDQLAARVASALDHPARKTAEGLALASEVRAHMKGMDEADRLGHAQRAASHGDKTTVAAIIHAPAYLSGLSDETLELVRSTAAKTFAPLDSAQLAATERVIQQVMNAGNALTGRYAAVISRRDSSAARAAGSLRALAGVG